MYELETPFSQINDHFDRDKFKFMCKIDFDKKVLCIDGEEIPLCDEQFPTVDPNDPYALTEGEQILVDGIAASFRLSAALRRHIDFIMSHGSMYKAVNGNLLYHGCIPMEEDGSFASLCINGRNYRGRELLDQIDLVVRRAYYQHDPECVDFMWYLWCGAKSPLYGKDRMTTFERYFTAADLPQAGSLREERKNPYYRYYEYPETVEAILRDFGLDIASSHIVNGHVPVRKGENPVKCGGKLFVIDGGISKAYQSTTGIAGYTLIYDSHGLTLAEHRPFQRATAKAIAQTFTKTRIVETMSHRIMISETDLGKEYLRRIAALEAPISCYRDGSIREKTANR